MGGYNLNFIKALITNTNTNNIKLHSKESKLEIANVLTKSVNLNVVCFVVADDSTLLFSFWWLSLSYANCNFIENDSLATNLMYITSNIKGNKEQILKHRRLDGAQPRSIYYVILLSNHIISTINSREFKHLYTRIHNTFLSDL